MTAGKNYFYLKTYLKEKQCMFVPAELVPEEIMEEHNLCTKIYNVKIFMRVNEGMCGPKEVGALDIN